MLISFNLNILNGIFQNIYKNNLIRSFCRYLWNTKCDVISKFSRHCQRRTAPLVANTYSYGCMSSGKVCLWQSCWSIASLCITSHVHTIPSTSISSCPSPPSSITAQCARGRCILHAKCFVTVHRTSPEMQSSCVPATAGSLRFGCDAQVECAHPQAFRIKCVMRIKYWTNVHAYYNTRVKMENTKNIEKKHARCRARDAPKMCPSIFRALCMVASFSVLCMPPSF